MKQINVLIITNKHVVSHQVSAAARYMDFPIVARQVQFWHPSAMSSEAGLIMVCLNGRWNLCDYCLEDFLLLIPILCLG